MSERDELLGLAEAAMNVVAAPDLPGLERASWAMQAAILRAAVYLGDILSQSEGMRVSHEADKQMQAEQAYKKRMEDLLKEKKEARG